MRKQICRDALIASARVSFGQLPSKPFQLLPHAIDTLIAPATRNTARLSGTGHCSHDDDEYDHISHVPSGKWAEAGNSFEECTRLRKSSNAYGNRKRAWGKQCVPDVGSIAAASW